MFVSCTVTLNFILSWSLSWSVVTKIKKAGHYTTYMGVCKVYGNPHLTLSWSVTWSVVTKIKKAGHYTAYMEVCRLYGNLLHKMKRARADEPLSIHAAQANS